MSPKKEKDKQIAGVIGTIVAVMVIMLLILGLSMMPNVLLFIQSFLGVDEFASQAILFILLAIGIGVLSYKGMEKYGG